MKKVQVLVVIILHLQIICQAQVEHKNFNNKKFNIGIFPSFYVAAFKDSLGVLKSINSQIIGLRCNFKATKKFYIGINANYINWNNKFLNEKQNGFTVGINLQKKYNINIYNKNCKPIFGDRIHYYYDLSLNSSTYNLNNLNGKIFYNTLHYFYLDIIPLNISYRIYKKIHVSYGFSFKFYDLSLSALRAQQIGIMYAN